MLRKILSYFVAGMLLTSTAFAQIPPTGVKDEGGAEAKPVFTIDCVGAGIACTHSGSTMTATVAGSAGDITAVGDCASGDAFGGACGNTLTSVADLSLVPTGGEVIITDGGKLQANSAGDDKNIQVYHDDVSGIIKSSAGVLKMSAAFLGTIFAVDTSEYLKYYHNSGFDQFSFVLQAAAGNQVNFVHNDERSTDMGHPQTDNPTVYIHSADGSNLNDYLALYHDQTNAKIESGSGHISFSSADDIVFKATGNDVFFGNADDSDAIRISISTTSDQAVWGVADDVGNQLVFRNVLNGYKDQDHPVQTNPTFFIQSDIDAAVSNNQWGSFAHDQENFVITTGVNVGTGTGATTDENAIVFAPRGTETARITTEGLQLTGTGRAWKCIDIDPNAITHPSADAPDDVVYQNVTYDAFDDGTEEQIFYVWHVPCDYATGTANVRGHFSGMVSNEAGTEYVAMGFEWWKFSEGDTVDISGAANGGGAVNIDIIDTEGNYIWHESATGVVDTTGWAKHDIVIFRFHRDVDDTYTGGNPPYDDNYTGDVLIGGYHMEYLIDSLGTAS